MSRDRMKLSGVRMLLADADRHGAAIVMQILNGFGVDSIKLVDSGAAAQAELEKGDCDLFLCDADLPDQKSADLIRWLRRLSHPVRFVPTLVLIGYAEFGNVTACRDAGAHLVIRKPASPQILYDRIAWASKSTQSFIEAESYVGPDRRFRFLGPPDGIGRRSTDLSAEIGEATEPNLSQAEIDSFVRPTKIFAE